MRQAMHIDHFVPQVIRKDLKCTYSNLLYACPACNSQKSDLLLPDPCKVALGQCLRVHPDGSIEALNDAGETIIDVLALDDPRTVERRRLLIGTLMSLAQSNWPMFVDWMRFPSDLPNLDDPKLRPPKNSKPKGVWESSFAMNQRTALPEVY